MNKRFIKISSCVAAILALLIGSLFIMPLHSVVAAPDDTSIMKKTLANAIASCYNSSYIHKDITPAGQFKTEDIFVYHFSSGKKGKVLILDDLGGSINCEQVFLGSKKTQGLNSLFNKNPTTPTNLGYVQSGDNNPSSTRCMSVSYKHASAEAGGNMVNYTSNSLCFGVMSDGKIDMDSFPSGGVPSSECIDPICLSANVQGKVFVNVLGNDGLHAEWEVAYFDTNMFAGGDGTKWDDLYKEVSNAVSGMNNDNGYANVSTNQTKTDDPGAFATYTINDYGEAAKAAFKYYTGSSNMDSQKFNQEDIDYLLDKAYAKMRSDGIISEDSTCFVGKDEALNQGTSYAHYNEGKKMWCPVYLNTGLAAGKTYNVVGNSLKGLYAASPEEILRIITKRDDGYATVGEMCNERAEERYDEFVNAWNEENAKGDKKDQAKLDYYKEQQQKIRQMINKPGGTYKTENGQTTCLTLPTVDGAPDTPPDTSGDNDGGTTGGDGSNGGNGGSSTDLDQCFSSAGALGWILCPVISFVSSATDSIYNDYIQSEFLEVKAENVSTGSDLYKSWQAIRNIANILFIIMFVLVVLSQITGLGISNYGIKKILPRLIIVAVLVNISFLLCQFAVDLSNILGYSLNEIFVKLSPDVNNGMGALGNVGSGVASVLTWGGIALLAINTAGAWLIPLLLALLTGIISVIFGGIILGLRQAGIIVLIVLAPVAIVCYALPNAKSFFDRWLKMFTSLLMVFPICGALMGGGFFASNLIVTSTDSVLLSIIAMLIRVAPFFMIPSLVRTALMAIGNIGNKVANWGNKMGRTATGAIARSDFVKQRDADLAKFQGDTTALRGRMLNRVLRKDPNELSDRRKAKIARQYAKYNKLRGEEASANPYALAPGTREYEAMKNAAHQNRIDSLAKNIALENTNIATDETALAERHAAALAALNEDQSDENLAAVQAYQDMLISSDGGRTKMFDNYAQATIAGQDKGIELGAQHLLRSHVKDIKPNNRDFFSYLGEASRVSNGGDIRKDSFQSFTDDKGNTHYLSNHFANQGVTSYDAASLAKMDEGSLDRLIQQARNGSLESDQKRVLEQYTRQAMTSDNIHVQDKIARKFNTLRDAMGYTRIQSQQQSDSGTIDVHDGGSNNPGSSSNSNNAGPIIRTGNDDRRGSDNGQRLNGRHGLGGTDDWRPNNDHGGIILPPGVR